MTYLYCNVVCVGCYNSDYGVIDFIDPELDWYWLIAGFFEKAIYG